MFPLVNFSKTSQIRTITLPFTTLFRKKSVNLAKLLSNDPHKKESANGNIVVTTSDLIGQDPKTAEKLGFKVHFV